MCGICGFCSPCGERVPLDAFYRAHRLLAHRGPDDEGFVVARGAELVAARGDDTIEHFRGLPHVASLEPAAVVLGNRRLEILDLTWQGHQPMVSDAGRVAMVFNGEIYNYVELAKDLESQGRVIASRSDTRVLLAAYETWGVEAFNRLNGMWAAAFWDADRRRLLLTRDRFGIKPLYYTLWGGGLAFASEVKSLLALTGPRPMDERLAADYLAWCALDHDEETLFQGIRQLRPGCYATWDEDGLAIHEYWKYRPAVDSSLSYHDALERLGELFASAVDLRLRSDVPVGAALSGGLDSTTIVCDVHRRHAPTNERFHLFTAVYPEEAYSERPLVELTVRQTGFPSHLLTPDPATFQADLDELLYFQEFPFRSLATWVQHLVMREAAVASPTVVLLEGQGGDEVFAGYTSHLATWSSELMRRGRPLAAARSALAWRRDRGASLRELARVLVRAPVLARRGGPRGPQRVAWLRGAATPPPEAGVSSDLLVDELFTNLRHRSLPEYLRYSDRNAMRWSLESRLPYLDFRLVEWAFTLPAEFKIRDGRGKVILRDFARPFIPASVADSRVKRGFTTPQALWQRTALAGLLDEALRPESLERSLPFVDAAEVSRRWAAYRDGVEADWTVPWRVFCLAAWKRFWIDGPGVRYAPAPGTRTVRRG